MSRHVSPEVRLKVATRADFLCEYCLVAEEDMFFGCEVEHIISLKHGGSSELGNLAYACAFCNRHKGSDIGSVSKSGEFSRFFNPRIDRWAEHFQLNGIIIQPLTVIGEVTTRILQLNQSDRTLERQALNAVARYPNKVALAYIQKQARP
jgi:HNH endonuclease